MAYAPTPIEIRFLAKVQRDPTTGCLLWIAKSVNRAGYGRILNENGRVELAHRVAWRLAGRPLLADQELDHFDCENILCCEVTHLRQVTHAANVARGHAPSAIAHRNQVCGRGHPMVAEHGRRYRGKWYCNTCKREKRRMASVDAGRAKPKGWREHGRGRI